MADDIRGELSRKKTHDRTMFLARDGADIYICMYAQRCGRSSYTDCRVFKLERTPPGPGSVGTRRAADIAGPLLRIYTKYHGDDERGRRFERENRPR